MLDDIPALAAAVRAITGGGFEESNASRSRAASPSQPRAATNCQRRLRGIVGAASHADVAFCISNTRHRQWRNHHVTPERSGGFPRAHQSCGADHRPWRCLTRAFDNCFENDHGDEVATAFLRRSRSNARLAADLPRYLRFISIEAVTVRQADVPTRKLTDVARQSRTCGKAEFDASCNGQNETEARSEPDATVPSFQGPIWLKRRLPRSSIFR